MQSRREVHERWMRRALEVARTGGLPAGAAPPGDPAHPADASPAIPALPNADNAPRRPLRTDDARRPDLPVGAVVIGPDGSELAAAANAREALGDPTAHAEVIALREAARPPRGRLAARKVHARGHVGAVHDVRGRGRPRPSG